MTRPILGSAHERDAGHGAARNSPGELAGIAFPAARRPRLVLPAIDEWPEAVRSAERIRGSLVACGPGIRPVGWPETPRVRLAALAPWLGTRYVAIRLTAAWVWGAAKHPGSPIECSTHGRKRAPSFTSPGLTVYEHMLTSDDICRIGVQCVTTPTRTLCDLLRSASPHHITERVACRLLLARHPGGRAAVHTALNTGARRYRRIATARLREL